MAIHRRSRECDVRKFFLGLAPKSPPPSSVTALRDNTYGCEHLKDIFDFCLHLLLSKTHIPDISLSYTRFSILSFKFIKVQISGILTSSRFFVPSMKTLLLLTPLEGPLWNKVTDLLIYPYHFNQGPVFLY